MNLVKVQLYAEGCYSKQSHEENIFIKEETYEKIKDKIKEIEIYIYDLDGKHSEAEGEITCIKFKEDELLMVDFDVRNDDDRLFWRLNELFDDDFDFEKEVDEVGDYIDSLDTMVTMEISVLKSQRDKVLEFVKSLNS